jgi:hypothetical protein
MRNLCHQVQIIFVRMEEQGGLPWTRDKARHAYFVLGRAGGRVGRPWSRAKSYVQVHSLRLLAIPLPGTSLLSVKQPLDTCGPSKAAD